MSLSTNILNITGATVQHCGGGEFHQPFDCVNVITGGGYVALFLPAGTGQSVADAINAAISPAMAEAAE